MTMDGPIAEFQVPHQEPGSVFPQSPPPDLRQGADHDCGQAAASVVRIAFGFAPKPIPLNWLDGTDVRLMEYAVRPDLCCQSGEMTLDDLAHHIGQARLVLCLVTDEEEAVGHWVVAYAVRSGLVWTQDPLHGLRSEPIPAFLARWRDWDRSGVLLRRWGLAVWRP